MSKSDQLREKHPVFSYDSYSWTLTDQKLLLAFIYTIGQHSFRHQIQITVKKAPSDLDSSILEELCFQTGMFEALSYWKLTASPKIHCKAGYLDDHQLSWWKDLIMKGMGEYFYVNSIDFTEQDFITLSSDEQKKRQTFKIKSSNDALPPTLLIPVGGGKDSATTLGMLNKYYQHPRAVLCINPTQAALDVAEVGQLDIITVSRIFDPKLFALNKEGYLNGHVPVSASIAMISSLVGWIYGFDYIVLANESSANEGNVLYKGVKINHQYSKSFEFEQKFQEYTHTYMTGTPFYFSLLRPCNELQIAKLFSELTEYHTVFRSCNKGSKTNSWCCQCSKCLFAWMMLYPFLETEKIVSIFGKNLYEDNSLWDTLLSLVKENAVKPFDCVGTKEETLVALFLALKKHHWQNLPTLLEQSLSEIIEFETNLESRSDACLSDWNNEHSIPSTLLSLVNNIKIELQ